ncbi:MAG: hypothetical protein ACE37N_06675 [Pseudohongiellaceae bacterium]
MSKVLIVIPLFIAWPQWLPKPTASNALVRLEQVRQTLLTQALDQGVSLVSHGYIDGSGRLVESVYFQTGTQARGVRMASYLDEMQEPVFSDPAVLPSVLRAGQTCSPRFASPVLINRVALPSVVPSSVVNQRQLAQDIQRAVMSNLQSGRRLSPVQNNPLGETLSSYERFMTGIVATQTALELDIELRYVEPSANTVHRLATVARNGFAAVRDAVAELATPAAYYPRLMIELRLTLVDTLENEQLVDFVRYYRVAGQHARLDQPPGLEDLPQRLAADIAEFAHHVESLQHCSLARLQLTEDSLDAESVRQLNRGSLHGVAVGMQLLMSGQDLNRVPDAMASGLLANLAIGEVIEVSPDSARVEIIAGNASAAALRFAVPF